MRLAFLSCVTLVTVVLLAMNSDAGDLMKLDFATAMAPEGTHVHAAVGSQVGFGPSEMTITARDQTYAHLEIPVAADLCSVSCQIQADEEHSEPSWCPAMSVYWDDQHWCRVGLNGKNFFVQQRPLRRGGFNETRSIPGAEPGRYHRVWIVLGARYVYFLAGPAVAERHLLFRVQRSLFPAGAPKLVILGKGYSDGAQYPQSHFDNSSLSEGPVSTCRFSDFVIRTTDEKEWYALDGDVLHWPPTPADLQPWVIPDDEREARQYEQTVYQGQEPTYEKVASFYPPIKYPNAIVGADGYPGKVYVAWNGDVVLPAVNENFSGKVGEGIYWRSGFRLAANVARRPWGTAALAAQRIPAGRYHRVGEGRHRLQPARVRLAIARRRADRLPELVAGQSRRRDADGALPGVPGNAGEGLADGGSAGRVRALAALRLSASRAAERRPAGAAGGDRSRGGCVRAGRAMARALSTAGGRRRGCERRHPGQRDGVLHASRAWRNPPRVHPDAVLSHARPIRTRHVGDARGAAAGRVRVPVGSVFGDWIAVSRPGEDDLRRDEDAPDQQPDHSTNEIDGHRIPSYGAYTYEGLLYDFETEEFLEAMDLYGNHDEARACLEYLLELGEKSHVAPGGEYTDSEGWLSFGQGNLYAFGSAGSRAICEHFRLTGDTRGCVR